MEGLAAGIAAYGLWGFVMPLYFRTVAQASVFELLAHRVVFGLPVMLAVVAVLRRGGALRRAVSSRRSALTLALSAFLIVINWTVFLYAIISENLMEASLGYFINPLFSVLLGMVFLHERLRPAQWAAVVVAAAAVAVLVADAGLSGAVGGAPWIAPVLVVSFGLYGLVRKQAGADAVTGLAVEMLFSFPLMAALLAALFVTGRAAFGAFAFGGVGPEAEAWRPLAAMGWDGAVGPVGGVWMSLALTLMGLMTAVPLVLFAAATRRVRLGTIGLMQYIAPTGQFLVALALGETLGVVRGVTFALVWVALAVYTWDSLRERRSLRGEPAAGDARPGSADP